MEELKVWLDLIEPVIRKRSLKDGSQVLRAQGSWLQTVRGYRRRIPTERCNDELGLVKGQGRERLQVGVLVALGFLA